jgi:hypothetical protein
MELLIELLAASARASTGQSKTITIQKLIKPYAEPIGNNYSAFSSTTFPANAAECSGGLAMLLKPPRDTTSIPLSRSAANTSLL